MTHHPHVHCIVPGGGISTDKQKWQACKKGFFLPVKVLSRLFRRLFVNGLRQLFIDARLQFFGELSELSDSACFDQWCTQQNNREWVVYAKRPFVGPEAVLAYFSRYTYRVAIANSRLRGINDKQVTFTFKGYRLKGRTKQKNMQLHTHEFIRRFMLHVLPTGFHRIRHYGLLASQSKLTLARRLLDVPAPEILPTSTTEDDDKAAFYCRQCNHVMVIMAIMQPLYLTRAPPSSRCKSDTNEI